MIHHKHFYFIHNNKQLYTLINAWNTNECKIRAHASSNNRKASLSTNAMLDLYSSLDWEKHHWLVIHSTNINFIFRKHVSIRSHLKILIHYILVWNQYFSACSSINTIQYVIQSWSPPLTHWDTCPIRR
jgi:hypothetical protein